MRGGMEAIYIDVPAPIGFTRFAPIVAARGPMFGAADPVGRTEQNAPAVGEGDLYR